MEIFLPSESRPVNNDKLVKSRKCKSTNPQKEIFNGVKRWEKALPNRLKSIVVDALHTQYILQLFRSSINVPCHYDRGRTGFEDAFSGKYLHHSPPRIYDMSINPLQRNTTSVDESVSWLVYANRRCGAWYTIPSTSPLYYPDCSPKCTTATNQTNPQPPYIERSVYFKSSDSHYGVWYFSKIRLNLHLLEPYLIGESSGISCKSHSETNRRVSVITDATQQGKTFPDALSKTLPIWVCVVNEVLFYSKSKDYGWDEPHGDNNQEKQSKKGQDEEDYYFKRLKNTLPSEEWITDNELNHISKRMREYISVMVEGIVAAGWAEVIPSQLPCSSTLTPLTPLLRRIIHHRYLSRPIKCYWVSANSVNVEEEKSEIRNEINRSLQKEKNLKIGNEDYISVDNREATIDELKHLDGEVKRGWRGDSIKYVIDSVINETRNIPHRSISRDNTMIPYSNDAGVIDEMIVDDAEVPPASNTLRSNTPKFQPHHPFILWCASGDVQKSKPREDWHYVTGAGDDHETWGRGLTPEIFWNQGVAEGVARKLLESMTKRVSQGITEGDEDAMIFQRKSNAEKEYELHLLQRLSSSRHHREARGYEAIVSSRVSTNFEYDDDIIAYVDHIVAVVKNAKKSILDSQTSQTTQLPSSDSVCSNKGQSSHPLPVWYCMPIGPIINTNNAQMPALVNTSSSSNNNISFYGNAVLIIGHLSGGPVNQLFDDGTLRSCDAFTPATVNVTEDSNANKSSLGGSNNSTTGDNYTIQQPNKHIVKIHLHPQIATSQEERKNLLPTVELLRFSSYPDGISIVAQISFQFDHVHGLERALFYILATANVILLPNSSFFSSYFTSSTSSSSSRSSLDTVVIQLSVQLADHLPVAVAAAVGLATFICAVPDTLWASRVNNPSEGPSHETGFDELLSPDPDKETTDNIESKSSSVDAPNVAKSSLFQTHLNSYTPLTSILRDVYPVKVRSSTTDSDGAYHNTSDANIHFDSMLLSLFEGKIGEAVSDRRRVNSNTLSEMPISTTSCISKNSVQCWHHLLSRTCQGCLASRMLLKQVNQYFFTMDAFTHNKY